MKNSLVLIAGILLFCSAALAGEPRDVLAHASGDWSWFAQVKPLDSQTLGDASAPNEQTFLYARENGPGQQWYALPHLSGRVTALAARSSQLTVLLSDGQWLTVWSDGSATGQPLPAGGRIKSIADDGTDLWAVGEVNGGITAAAEDIARRNAATQPTTDRTRSETAADSTLPTEQHLPAKLVIFRQKNGNWAAITELPGDAVVLSPDDLSMVIVNGNPVISYSTFKNAVRTMAFQIDHGWSDLGRTGPEADAGTFRVLSDGFKPFLWRAEGKEAGSLFSGLPLGQAHVDCMWNSKQKLDGTPTAIFSGGYLCVFGPHNLKVFEQRYKLDGTPVETAAELMVHTDYSDSGIPHWLESVFLCSLGFTVGSSVFRQWSNGEEEHPPQTLTPAPLLPRLAAGILDGLPVIAAVIYLTWKTPHFYELIQVPTWPTVAVFAGAMLVYLLHTTLSEMYTGRTAGKWLFGLKVVTVDGNVPTQSQYMIRNLLRIIDPLVMILISPLGQRTADTVADTMVVGMDIIPSDAESVTGPTELAVSADVDSPEPE